MVETLDAASVVWRFSTRSDEVYIFFRGLTFMSRARTADTVAREITKSYKSARKLIMDGMKKTTAGSRASLDHIRALADLDRRHRQERADRGIDAQNLGVAAKAKYVFIATVDAQLTDGRSAGDRLMVEKLDAEFADLPAPQIDADDANEQPQVQPLAASDDELEEDEDNELEEELESYGN
jgi:hypothetical protein